MQTYEARDLIRRCATERDAETWQEFQERFSRPLAMGVRRTLLRFDARIGDDEHQDLLQETYCRLLEGQGRRLRSCRGEVEGAISAYLGRVAESVVVDFLRGRNAAKRGGGVVVDLHRGTGTELADRMIDPRRTPEEKLLLRERRARFLARCGKLVGKRSPERDLQVFYLALFEGWTSREICQRMGQGLKPSTVDSLIHRLRKRFTALGIDIPRRRSSRVFVVDLDP
jgi:RNA polymerase sigma factor (sigma-70 family)